MRRECVWCEPHHPVDGKGEITQAERDAGVKHTICEVQRKRALEELAKHVQDEPDTQELERLDLLRRADEPLPEAVETDKAGVATSALSGEYAIRWLLIGAGIVLAAFALASLIWN